jgi:hypothetical protein
MYHSQKPLDPSNFIISRSKFSPLQALEALRVLRVVRG